MLSNKLWIVIIFIISLYVRSFSSQFNNKAKVKLSDILKENRKYRSEAWPPDNPDTYYRVNVKLLGDKTPTAFDASFKPLRQHMQKKKLKKLFWKYDLDLVWLSIQKPSLMSGTMPNTNDDQYKELIEATNSLNFTFIDSVGTVLEMPGEMQMRFKSWLIQYSTCQMTYVWEDLGEMFWPRWIRRGLCTNNRSCSWPNGMGCKFSGSRTLYLLRWGCEKDANGIKSRSHQEFMYKLKQKKKKRKLRYFSYKRRRIFRNSRPRNQSISLKKKKRRAERIIQKLSRPVSGHFCQWSMIKYYINDKCSCQCK